MAMEFNEDDFLREVVAPSATGTRTEGATVGTSSQPPEVRRPGGEGTSIVVSPRTEEAHRPTPPTARADKAKGKAPASGPTKKLASKRPRSAADSEDVFRLNPPFTQRESVLGDATVARDWVHATILPGDRDRLKKLPTTKVAELLAECLAKTHIYASDLLDRTDSEDSSVTSAKIASLDSRIKELSEENKSTAIELRDARSALDAKERELKAKELELKDAQLALKAKELELETARNEGEDLSIRLKDSEIKLQEAPAKAVAEFKSSEELRIALNTWGIRGYNSALKVVKQVLEARDMDLSVMDELTPKAVPPSTSSSSAPPGPAKE